MKERKYCSFIIFIYVLCVVSAETIEDCTVKVIDNLINFFSRDFNIVKYHTHFVKAFWVTRYM